MIQEIRGDTGALFFVYDMKDFSSYPLVKKSEINSNSNVFLLKIKNESILTFDTNTIKNSMSDGNQFIVLAKFSGKNVYVLPKDKYFMNFYEKVFLVKKIKHQFEKKYIL